MNVIVYVNVSALTNPDGISDDFIERLKTYGSTIRHNGVFHNPEDIIPYVIRGVYSAFAYEIDKRRFVLYDVNKERLDHVIEDSYGVDLINMLKKYGFVVNLKENPEIWARYFRDGLTLDEIAKEFKCGINDLEFLVECQHRIIDVGIKSNKLLKGIL